MTHVRVESGSKDSGLVRKRPSNRQRTLFRLWLEYLRRQAFDRLLIINVATVIAFHLVLD